MNGARIFITASLLIFVYFLPVLHKYYETDAENIEELFWLNLLLGWTIFGWFALAAYGKRADILWILRATGGFVMLAASMLLVYVLHQSANSNASSQFVQDSGKFQRYAITRVEDSLSTDTRLKFPPHSQHASVQRDTSGYIQQAVYSGVVHSYDKNRPVNINTYHVYFTVNDSTRQLSLDFLYID